MYGEDLGEAKAGEMVVVWVLLIRGRRLEIRDAEKNVYVGVVMKGYAAAKAA